MTPLLIRKLRGERRSRSQLELPVLEKDARLKSGVFFYLHDVKSASDATQPFQQVGRLRLPMMARAPLFRRQSPEPLRSYRMIRSTRRR